MVASGSLKTPGCPPSVLDLIQRFELHRDTYKRQTYNEAQVRDEFINPFFETLGWDIHNRDGYAEAYKDVIHEDAIKVGGFTKAPDYCFRIGGVRKFFVEAKKPAEDIKQKREHAYQLRRYAWTAKLPISILTDFEEFAVFDCTSVDTHEAEKRRQREPAYGPLNRHGVLHGRDLDYATEPNSLRAVLLIAYLAEVREILLQHEDHVNEIRRIVGEMC